MTHAETRAQIVAKLRSRPYRNPFGPNSRSRDPEIDASNRERWHWMVEAGHFNAHYPDERIMPAEVDVAPIERAPVDVNALPALRGVAT